jgi:hypothetical protein
MAHILLAAGGLIMLLNITLLLIIGAILILIGALVYFFRSGILIDLNNQKYRHYIVLLGFVTGKWEVLPVINYVAIVRVRLSKLKFRPSEISFRQVDEGFDMAYNVNLIFKTDSKRYLKVYSGDLDMAMEKASFLASLMKVNVWDSSTSQKRWIQITPGNSTEIPG